MDLTSTQNVATGGGLVGGIVGCLYVIKNIVTGNRVTEASDSAQVNIIEVLQHERDAAVKRADDAIAAREAAMEQLNDLKLQIVNLQNQVKQLSEQVAKLTGAMPVEVKS